MPITSTIQQGTLSLAAVTPGNSAIGDAAAAGTSASVARADHKHGREASGTPGASAVGDTASTGSATTVALSDHRHSREAFGTPVNIDASLTSLSTGSLTTVARADHVHTVSKVPVLLASTTLASDAASVTFSSISQSYKHLLVVYQVRIVGGYGGALEYMMMRCNGDTGANYWDGVANSTSATMAHFASISATTNYDTAFSCGSGYVFSYTNTLSVKSFGSYFSPWNNSTTAFSPASWATSYSSWRNTAAITSITFLNYNGFNLKSGSNIQIYGMP